jgi:hypothetical protein
MSAMKTHTNKRNNKSKNVTRKRKKRSARDDDDNDGWLRVTIRGAPYDRGVSHGKQIVAADPTMLARMFSAFDFIYRQSYGRDIEFFYGLCDDFYKGIIKRRFPKIFREMEGIAAGAGLDVRQAPNHNGPIYGVIPKAL